MARLIALENAPNGVLSDVGTDGKLEPLVSHQVYVYQPGTLTQVDVWQDENGSTPLSQPLTTDSTGAIPGFAQAEQPVDFYDATAGIRIRSQLISAADMSDVLGQQLPVLPAVQVVATTNQALSGLRTIDGYALQSNDTILLTGQSDPKQNGPWKVASGSWTRPGVFAHAAVVTAREVSVLNGSQAQSRWQLVTNASLTVDTSSQTWTQFPEAGAPAPDPQGLKRGYGGASDWATKWKTARATAGSRLVTIVDFGASIGAGCYTTQVGARDNGSGGRTDAKDWFGIVTAALQDTYGDGGSGWISSHEVAVPNGRVVAGGTGGTSGGWNEFYVSAGVEYLGGYNGYGLYPAAAGSGVSLTFNAVRGKHITILFYPVAGSAFQYSIDGGATTSVAGTGSADTMKAILPVTPTATPGDWHTVQVFAQTGVPAIYAVGGFNDAGIVGHNCGHNGRHTDTAVLSSGLSAPGWRNTHEATVWGVPRALTPVGGAFPTVTAPDVLILSDDIAINDALGGATPPFGNSTSASHAGGLGAVCQSARESNPDCEIIILSHPYGAFEIEHGLYPQYQATAQAVAKSYGGTHLDMAALYRNSITTLNAANYYGPGTGGDGDGGFVHPGNVGHGLIASQLTALLEA